MAAIGRMILAMILGAILGALFWCFCQMMAGQSIQAALEGKVEDALPELQAMIELGLLIGTGIGLLWVVVFLLLRKQRSNLNGSGTL
jgi:hypothetical protein